MAEGFEDWELSPLTPDGRRLGFAGSSLEAAEHSIMEYLRDLPYWRESPEHPRMVDVELDALVAEVERMFRWYRGIKPLKVKRKASNADG